MMVDGQRTVADKGVRMGLTVIAGCPNAIFRLMRLMRCSDAMRVQSKSAICVNCAPLWLGVNTGREASSECVPHPHY